MQSLEKQIKKTVSELGEKISKRKGEIILSFREFYVPKDGGCFGSHGDKFNYYETGIITGEMQKNEAPKMKDIDLSHFKLKIAGHESNYCIWGDYSIPVDRKISGFINNFGNNFYFDIKDLEELKPGQVLIDTTRDFGSSLTILDLLNDHRKSELKKTDFLVGNEEIEKFLIEKKIENSGELFKILQNPESVKRQIENYYFGKREQLGEKLAITANEIMNAFRKVKSLEDNIMRAYYVRENDQGGSDISHWDESHVEEVHQYSDLKIQINSIVPIINNQLEKGKELFFIIQQPFIDGTTIGFPEKTSFNKYFNWLKNSLLPEINNTFEKIDSYLNRQQKEAHLY